MLRRNDGEGEIIAKISAMKGISAGVSEENYK